MEPKRQRRLVRLDGADAVHAQVKLTYDMFIRRLGPLSFLAMKPDVVSLYRDFVYEQIQRLQKAYSQTRSIDETQEAQENKLRMARLDEKGKEALPAHLSYSDWVSEGLPCALLISKLNINHTTPVQDVVEHLMRWDPCGTVQGVDNEALRKAVNSIGFKLAEAWHLFKIEVTNGRANSVLLLDGGYHASSSVDTIWKSASWSSADKHVWFLSLPLAKQVDLLTRLNVFHSYYFEQTIMGRCCTKTTAVPLDGDDTVDRIGQNLTGASFENVLRRLVEAVWTDVKRLDADLRAHVADLKAKTDAMLETLSKDWTDHVLPEARVAFKSIRTDDELNHATARDWREFKETEDEPRQPPSTKELHVTLQNSRLLKVEDRDASVWPCLCPEQKKFEAAELSLSWEAIRRKVVAYDIEVTLPKFMKTFPSAAAFKAFREKLTPEQVKGVFQTTERMYEQARFFLLSGIPSLNALPDLTMDEPMAEPLPVAAFEAELLAPIQQELKEAPTLSGGQRSDARQLKTHLPCNSPVEYARTLADHRLGLLYESPIKWPPEKRIAAGKVVELLEEIAFVCLLPHLEKG
jgi:hypothetical protein